MARCAHCGRVNRDGALFCQDCGQRLPPSAPEPVQMMSPPAGIARGATCPACGSVNPPGMNFCKMCGGALRAAGAPVAPSPMPMAPAHNSSPVPSPIHGGGSAPVVVGGAMCTSCGRATPPGYQFCQHCGARLAPPAPAQHPTPGPLPSVPPGAYAATVAAGHHMSSAPVPVAAPPMPSSGGRAAQNGPPGYAHSAPAYHPPSPPPGYQGTPAFGAPVPGSVTVPAGGVSRAPFGRLVAVSRSGQDGDAYPLRGDMVDLGRSEGELTFDDPFLAPRHARVERRGGQVVLKPLDQVNGVYVRVREPWPLEDGDHLLLGKEVLRFELVRAPEKDPPTASQHGVMLFGSPARSPWARLRQITGAGISRDVVHMVRAELTVGREDGELLFPDDEFMSRRHATVAGDAQRAHVTDLGSSNGTFVRLRAERVLRPGDLFRVGDQLLRFEPT